MQQHLLLHLFLSFLCVSLCHSVSVRNANDLISLFDNPAGGTLKEDIVLLDDLDFSASTLTLPLGTLSDGTCMAFSGTIQGNGHSIIHLNMNNIQSGRVEDAGLFCSLKDFVVENLVIDSSCYFIGDAVGALSVSVNGSLTVKIPQTRQL